MSAVYSLLRDALSLLIRPSFENKHCTTVYMNIVCKLHSMLL